MLSVLKIRKLLPILALQSWVFEMSHILLTLSMALYGKSHQGTFMYSDKLRHLM